jgi:hypothetical protein
VIRDNNAAFRYLVLNETNARYVDPNNTATQTLLPVILQINVPNNTTVTGQCLLYGFNSTDFSANGDNIEVVIDSATTFKWRRNGGAYTTGVAIASVVSIGANGLKLAFQTTTGFTVSDTWKWQRYNTLPTGDATTSRFVYDKAFYNTDAYFGGISRNIMRVRDGFITNVGYKRVYGKYVGVFNNHLIVGQFAEGVYNAISGVVDPFTAADTPFVLGWSDLNNPDNFFSTDVNEADTYPMPYNDYPDGLTLGITGMGQLGHTNWIYTADSMSSMDYVGLPRVFQILPAHPVGSIYPNGLVKTKVGHYFIARDNIYFFDGVQPRPIGDPVRKKLYSELMPATETYYDVVNGAYDPTKREVSWTYIYKNGSYYQVRQVVYMERYDRWFFRNMPDDSGALGLGCRCTGRTYADTERMLYGGLGAVWGDINAEGVGSILPDLAGASPSYTNPYAETNDLNNNDIFHVKETDGIMIDAGWTSGVTGLEVGFQRRALISEAVSLSALSQRWTNAQPGMKLGVPRGAGRVWRFSFTMYGTKPYGCVLNGWGDTLYDQGMER